MKDLTGKGDFRKEMEILGYREEEIRKERKQMIKSIIKRSISSCTRTFCASVWTMVGRRSFSDRALISLGLKKWC